MKTAAALLAFLAIPTTSRADEPSGPVGRYQAAPAANGAVWRLDTATGELELCDMSAKMFPFITCVGVTHVVKNPAAIGQSDEADPLPPGTPNIFDQFDPDKAHGALQLAAPNE